MHRDRPKVSRTPILAHKHYDAVSAFTPENLLREARRQKQTVAARAPALCVLDPDGDLVRQLELDGRTRLDPDWPCYHTDMHCVTEGGLEFGASFAVLIAEQLFASGCELLISMTSAGQLVRLRPPPYFILIEKALRDEGTSYHYLPPAEFSHGDNNLLQCMAGAFSKPA